MDVPICDGCKEEIPKGRAYLIAIREWPDKRWAEKVEWEEADAPDIVGRYHLICYPDLPSVRARQGLPDLT
jgi:hypothetical protein